MSENRDERESKKLEDERLEQDAKRLKEQAEEEQRQKDEEAAAEEARKRRAAAAAAERARQAAAAAAAAREQAVAQQKNKLEPKSQPQIQETPKVVFSPEIARLKPPVPGATPRPEPDFIKKFRDDLEDDKKHSMNYDPERGQLTFTGAKGLDALIKFLEENRDVKITLDVGRDMLKGALRELKNHQSGTGTLLDKLSAIEMDDKLIQKADMRKIIQDKVGSPRPSPTNGME